MRHTHAIVRQPGRSVRFGTSKTLHLGRPVYDEAVRQHAAFVDALRQCGVEVVVLPALEDYPDSCFVGDLAVQIGEGVVVCNLESASRQGERAEIESALHAFFPENRIVRIEAPGTIEGSDVVVLENHVYVGEGQRTNGDAVMQLGHVLRTWGMSCVGVKLRDLANLHSGLSYLGDGCMVVAGEMERAVDFIQYFRINAPEGEEPAANCLSVNGKVIMAQGYPKTAEALQESGYEVLAVDVGEFRKIDGGLSDLCILLDLPQ